tara:strand:- start:54 stop:392 length:339 start_codon:yes stop_codon:yes gene_type:complete
MRLDHFVKLNNHLTITKGLNMTTTKSITNSRGLQPSESVWIDSMKKDVKGLIWGRIQNTGINYVVEGYIEERLEWVSIPCRRIQDAQLLLGAVMPKKDFAIHRELRDINNGQ